MRVVCFPFGGTTKTEPPASSVGGSPSEHREKKREIASPGPGSRFSGWWRARTHSDQSFGCRLRENHMAATAAV